MQATPQTKEYRKISDAGQIPVRTIHNHVRTSQLLARTLRKAMRDGIVFGEANNSMEDKIEINSQNNTDENTGGGATGALSAVETLLGEIGEPLNGDEICRLIIQRGLWKTESESPLSVLHAQLSVDLRKHGSKSRFQRINEGVYALRQWGMSETPRQGYRENERLKKRRVSLKNKVSKMTDEERRDYLSEILDTPKQWPTSLPELPAQINQNNKDVELKLREQLHKVEPSEFEELITKLLFALGFEDAITTGRSGDGGIDVRGTLLVGDAIRVRMAVQVKRWRNNVQAPIIQQLRGSLDPHEHGLVITISDFSSGARTEAEKITRNHAVALMNGKQLVRLLIQNNMGTRRKSYELFELNSDEQFLLDLEPEN